MKYYHITIIITFLYILSPVSAEDIPLYKEVSSIADLQIAISEMKFMTGGAIFIKEGIYLIDRPILINEINHVSIFGAGIGKTVIQRKGNGDVFVFSGTCNSCSIRNLSIIGDKKAINGSGIVFQDTDWSGLSTIDSCEINDFADYGIYFHGREMTPQSSGNVIHCMFKNNRKAQINSYSHNDFTYIFNHLIIDEPACMSSIGILMRYSSAGTISHNYISNCGTGILMSKSCSLNRIEYNYFDDCNQYAIDCGMVVPDEYDVSSIPREQLYASWEWSISHKIRINSENLFFKNEIYSSGINSDFIGLRAVNSSFITFSGNKMISDRKVDGFVNLDRNCMAWILTDNKWNGEIVNSIDISLRKQILNKNNSEINNLKFKSPKFKISELSTKLKMIFSDNKEMIYRVNNTEQFNKVLNELPVSGGTIFLEAGIYRISGPIVIENKNNINIIGAGLSTFVRNTGNSDLFVFAGKCSNIYIANMTIMPDEASPWTPIKQKAGSGINFMATGTNITIDYCILDSWPESCIKISGKSNNKIKNIKIVSNWFIRGIKEQLHLSNVNGFQISNNSFGYTFPDKSPIGAYINQSTNGLYERNYHWGNKIGIWISEGCSDIKILENRSEQSKENGLLIGNPEKEIQNNNIDIIGNSFHTNPEMDLGTASNVRAINTDSVNFYVNQVYTWWDQRKSSNGVDISNNCDNWKINSNYIRDFINAPIAYNEMNNIAFKANIYDYIDEIKIEYNK